MRQLMKSGKGVEETLAAINLPQFRGRGPLHMAAWAGRLEMCRFLVKDLRLNVNAPGDEGNFFVIGSTVLALKCWIDLEWHVHGP
jgi:ankyrin repeat protein